MSHVLHPRGDNCPEHNKPLREHTTEELREDSERQLRKEGFLKGEKQ